MQSMEQKSLCASYQLIHSLSEQTELLPIFFFETRVMNSQPVLFFYLPCQEASQWIPEVFWDQPPMELLSVVLLRWRGLWISSIPYFWSKGLETNVYQWLFYCLQCCFILIHHPCQSLLNFEFFGCQVFLRFQPHLRWCGNDLLTPCEPFDPLWCYTFLGDIVATHQQTKGKLVPSKCTREQHDKLVWLQGLLEHLPFFQIRLLGMKKGFTEYFHCVPGAVLSVYSSDYGRWSLPPHQSHGYHC